MGLSNLPPGVTDADIEAQCEDDPAFEKLVDEIWDSRLLADEARRRWESQPDLLAACENILTVLQALFCDSMDETTYRTARVQKCRNVLRHVIKQAKGES